MAAKEVKFSTDARDHGVDETSWIVSPVTIDFKRKCSCALAKERPLLALSFIEC